MVAVAKKTNVAARKRGPRCVPPETHNGVFRTHQSENRLIKTESLASVPDAAKVKVENLYDYMGRRVRKTLSSDYSGGSYTTTNVTTFIYDGWNPIAEITDDGSTVSTNYHIWGLDASGTLQGAGGVGGLLATIQDGETYFACMDGNGNVCQYVDTNGTVVAHREYDPYGGTIALTGDKKDDFTHWWSTKPLDDETGLVMYEHRPYAPSIGRFTSRDPFGDFSFFVRYASQRPWHEQYELERRFFNTPAYRFVDNDPINAIDPLGLYTVKKCTIVLFYGHGKISFFKGVKVKKCAGTTAVTCQSQIIFTYLAGVIPGAVDSGGNDVRWGGIGPPPSGTVDADPLIKQNVAAMEAYAKTLCKAPCCCKKVKLKQKCVGTWWECIARFYGSSDLPKTIKCK